MNKIIEDQLRKCKVADIPEFNDSTISLTIHKKNLDKKSADIELNHYYKIEIANYVLTPNENFTLAENWNNGTVPPEARMNCEIKQIMGKMVQVFCIGETTQKTWGGWLPRKSFNIVEEL